MRLDAHLLGGVAFVVDGQLVKALPTRAAQALFVYVLYHPQPVPRERLIDLFFQNSNPKQAAANLRSALSRIKKGIGPYLLTTRENVSVDREAEIFVDSAEFSRLLSANDHNPSITAIKKALTIYHGDFLAGFFLRDAPEFEQWALVERERLRLLAIDGLQKMLNYHKQRAEYRPALRYCNQLLAVEPLLEDVQRDKLLLLARTGQRALALQHFIVVEQIFADELGIDLTDETHALRQRIEALPAQPDHNLPPERGKFIGRNNEITQLVRLLAQPNQRLITLHGVGGIGKTRLALQIARHLLQENAGLFLDGIYFVPLVMVNSAEAIIQQLAIALNIPQQGKQPLRQRLFTWLQQRELLLLLDNFEHLLQDDSVVELITHLLTDAPQLKLLVTSRERLNLYEETVFDVKGLTLPAENPRQAEAVDLFLTHARRQKADFAPDDQQFATIAEICHLLAGVPLALELAAGWIRQFDLVQIASAIRDNLDFLTTTIRNVPPRQRSMRAVFRYSWALLAPDLAVLLAKLSVFPDTFEQQAAQAIAGATQQQLQALVAKSLLQQVEKRYSIHPLLREFSAEHLPSHSPIHQQHARYYLAWIATASETYLHTGQDHIRVEAANLRQAWGLAIETLAYDQLQLAARPLLNYWAVVGWIEEGIALAESALAVAQSDDKLRQQIQIQLGFLLRRQGNFALAAQTLDHVLKELGAVTTFDRALALEGIALSNLFLGEPEKAEQFAATAVAIYAALDDMPNYAHISCLLLDIKSHLNKDDSDYSVKQLLQLATYPRYRADILNFMGRRAIGAGEYAQAVVHLQESQQIMRQLGIQSGYASATVNLAVAAQFGQQWALAEQTALTALQQFRRVNEQFGMAIALRIIALMRLKQGDIAAAQRGLLQAYQLNVRSENKHGMALMLTDLGYVAARLQSADALQQLQIAGKAVLEIQSLSLLSSRLPTFAMGLAEIGYHSAAVTLATVAIHADEHIEAHARRDAEQLLETLRAELPTPIFAKAQARGKTLSCVQAVELLLLDPKIKRP